MENSQMTENIFKPTQSSPHEVQKSPSKRRKLDTTDSSTNANSPNVNVSHWELKRLRTHFRAKLSHIGTSTNQLQNIRKQIEKMFENEAKKLEMQAQVDIETLEQLERHLNIENTPRDPLEHQTPAEVDVSPIKSPMKQKLLDLLPEHTKLKNIIFPGLGGTPTSPDTPCPLESHPEAPKTLKDLSNKITTIPHLQSHKKIESRKCMVKIEKLNTEKIFWEEKKTILAEKSRVKDLENEVKSSRDTISSLREDLNDKIILEQQVSGLKKALEHAETREKKLKSRCEELSSKVEDYESRLSGGGKRGQRPQLVESGLRAENGELRAQVEMLKRENEELRKKFEGGEQRKGVMMDKMRTVKVELVRDELSNGQGDGENYLIDGYEDSIDVVGGDSIDSESIGRDSSDGVSSDGLQVNTDNPGKAGGALRGESEEKRKISIGLFYVLPSSQNYFDIDFDAQYVRKDKATFVCGSCEGIYNTKPKIIDHLWSVHYQGRWHCPYCSCTAADRYGMVGHVKRKHRSKISGE